MKSKFGFCYTIALAILALLVAAPSANALSANYTATVTVNINISSVGSIVVLPNSLSWTSGGLGSLNPGADSSAQNLIIKNTGSLNVSMIFMNASTVSNEYANPLQTANATNYSAAGLVMVKNATDTLYSHAGRLEWNLSGLLSGENVGSLTGITNFSHGWYRNSSGNEYLWALKNGTGGLCNDTGTTFTIKTSPENATNMNRDLTSGTTGCGSITAGPLWGTFACSTGPLNGQCVAVAKNCDKVLIYKYYGVLSDYPTCVNADYLRRANIVPGDEAAFSVIASIPKGVPAGDTRTGTLTIFAQY